jgi:outer membrane lipoprotein SlyB
LLNVVRPCQLTVGKTVGVGVGAGGWVVTVTVGAGLGAGAGVVTVTVGAGAGAGAGAGLAQAARTNDSANITTSNIPIDFFICLFLQVLILPE